MANDLGAAAPSRKVDCLDAKDEIERLLSQLSAAVHMTYGAAGEAFRESNDSHQDNYLWMISCLIDQLAEHWERHQEAFRAFPRAA